MRTFFTLIVGAIIFLLGVGVGSFVDIAALLPNINIPYPAVKSTPTPTAPAITSDPTANWKIDAYKDLSFKYPRDWNLEINKKMPILLHPANQSAEFPNISIYTIANPNNLTVKEYKTLAEKEGPEPNFYSDTAIIREVSGITGYYQENQGCEPLLCDIFAISYKQNIYIAQLVYPDKVNTGLRSDFNLFLSTFEFLNQTTGTSSQTYTGNTFVYPNSVYSGYTFQYPSTCKLTAPSLSCTTSSGNTFKLLINAGGHGLDNSVTFLKKNEVKSYPGGDVSITLWKAGDNVGGVYWFNKTDKIKQDFLFGFELYGATSTSISEAETIVNQILSTFKFTQ